MRANKVNLVFVFLFGIILFSSLLSAYVYSDPQYTQSALGFNSGLYGFSGDSFFDVKQCGAGQDFILNVAPLGCSPPVVRSDLLADQDSYVFCPIQATKLNPLIDVKAIDYLTFEGDFPPQVSDIGFQPRHSALGAQGNLNSPVLENIGYAAIRLKRNPKEADLPDFIEGNITAKIRYDIENAFGVGQAEFYLPKTTDAEWAKNYPAYNFWKGRAFVRAEDVTSDGATISVYSGHTNVVGPSSFQQKIATFDLKKGEESRDVYLPTFDYCMGGLKVQLDDIDKAEISAKFRVSGDEIEVREGESFLNGKCHLNKINVIGLNQEVFLNCKEDSDSFFGKSTDMHLTIIPQINISLDGHSSSYNLGDKVLDLGGGKAVYLAYAYTSGNSQNEDDLKVGFISLEEQSESKKTLTPEELDSFSGYFKRYRFDSEYTGIPFADFSLNAFKSYGYLAESFGRWLSGESFSLLNYQEFENFENSENKEISLKVEGLSGPSDSSFSKESENYLKANADFDSIISDFSDINYDQTSDKYGEKSLAEKIDLAYKTGQKKTMYGLCEKFKKTYPKANRSLVPQDCFNDVQFASSGISTQDVFVDQQVKEISFRGVYEPGFQDYGAEILIEKAGEVPRTVLVGKEGKIYLGKSGTSSSGSAGDIYAGGSSIEEGATIVKALVEQEDFTPAAAAGIVGNILVESDNFKADIEYNTDGKGGRGWIQWTGSRRKAFEKWVTEKGLSFTSVDANYGYLVYEMSLTGKKSQWTGRGNLADMKKMTDAEKAAVYFMNYYERPRASSSNEEKRKENALLVLNMYNHPSENLRNLWGGSSVVSSAISSSTFSWPTKSKTVTSCYGSRTLDGKNNYHDGIDIGVQEGTKVYAAGDGEVIHTCTQSESNNCHNYGTNIIIKHDNGYFSVYNHLSEIKVSKEKRVKSGDLIGLSGNTGSSEGPHLHFGIYKSLTGSEYSERFNDKGFNPLCFLPSGGVEFSADSCKPTFSENAFGCGNTQEFSSIGASSSGDYLRLKNLEDDFAEMDGVISSRSAGARAFTTNHFTLEKDVPEPIGDYTFTLKKVNLKKVAKVSINSNIDYANSESTFKFHIPVEKRNIKFAPDKIQEKIDKLNESIAKWEKLSEGLGKTVKVMKGACFGVGGALTFTNLIKNAGGKGIARQRVMRANGGWYDICADYVKVGKYKTVDQCLIKESSNIDSDVNKMNDLMQAQDKKMRNLEAGHISKGKGLFGEDVVDSHAVVKDFSPTIVSKLDNNLISEINKEDPEKPIDFERIKSSLSIDGFDKAKYSLDDLKKIELYSDILKDTSNKDSPLYDLSKKELYSTLYSIQKNSELFVEEESFSEKTKLGDSSAVLSLVEDSHEIPLSSRKTFSSSAYGQSYTFSGPVISPDDYVFAFKEKTSGEKYLLTYGVDGSVKQTYKVDDSSLSLVPTDSPNPLNIVFKKYDKTFYENEFKRTTGSKSGKPEVRFYESEPYKGLPAIVPFDLNNGWYAATKATLPVGGNVRSFDASGRVNSFYLCNVGSNGVEEFFGSSGFGDDSCQMIDLNVAQTYTQFGGLNKDETKTLVSDAVSAIEQVSSARERDANIQNVGIRTTSGGSIVLPVGKPAVNVPDIQCQDFMSPKECTAIFNVCDPVICPTSRCDFGGAYPVNDVAQTGIFGSIALCAPNFREGIAVPVCLTGVEAGLDNWVSIQKSARDCLTENLNSGENIGICDEITGVYTCEFFWRQAAPLAKIAIPKLVSKGLHQNVRGGGEYLGFKNAFESVSKLKDYFVKDYGLNAYKAFKARSLEEIGTPVCKNFISAPMPKISSLLDQLTEPDSPNQFTGRFQEIPYSTVTVPPISHYKVFYHVYAGKDTGAYYRVYLKDSEQSSYYQDLAPLREVKSGYIPVGEYATGDEDFTAPSGYKKLCIMVNGYEECGFKSVTSSAGINYVKDSYLKQQAEQTDITTESECVSGTASLYNLLDPNLQSAAENAINPQISRRGIIRICATNNPGLNTDPNANIDGSRWKQVGFCGDKSLGCWLDQNSVEDSIKFANIRNKTVSDLEDYYLNKTKQERNYDFDGKVKEINEEGNPKAKIALINDFMDKVFYSSEKAKLFFLRGIVYKKLAISDYPAWLKEHAPKELEGQKEESNGESFISLKYELDNYCYEYFENSWHWTDNCDKVGVPQFTTTGPGEVMTSQPLGVVYEWQTIKPNPDNKIVLKLLNKDYEGGLKVLIDNTVNTNGQEFVLKTKYAQLFTKNRIFSIDDSEIGEVYFSYSDNKKIWSWNLNNNENLLDSSWRKLNSLEDSDLYSGARVLFEGNRGFNEIKSKVLSNAQTSSKYPSKYDSLISKYADSRNLDFNLVKAVIFRESSFNPEIVSSAGAVGLMQLLPSTAGLSKEELYDPEKNINAGTNYLKKMISKYGSNPDAIKLGLASYNAGPGRIGVIIIGTGRSADKVSWDEIKSKSPSETQKYVENVLSTKVDLENEVGSSSDSFGNTFALDEKRVIISASSCSDCGNGVLNACGQKECEAVSNSLIERGEKGCDYESWRWMYLGNPCRPKE